MIHLEYKESLIDEKNLLFTYAITMPAVFEAFVPNLQLHESNYIVKYMSPKLNSSYKESTFFLIFS